MAKKDYSEDFFYASVELFHVNFRLNSLILSLVVKSVYVS